MRIGLALLVCLVSLAPYGCKSPQASAPPPAASAPTAPAWITSTSGLGIRDINQGTGPSPRPGQTCVVYAKGWVEEPGNDGTTFLDTRKRGFPDVFPIGAGRVIKGWDEGLATMKKGGKRLLRVPPSLGYAPNEMGKGVTPGATLIFELELLEIR